MDFKKEKQNPPQVHIDKGLELLKKLIEKAKQLLDNRPLSSDDYSSWKLVALNYLEKIFGKESTNISGIMDVGEYGAFPMAADERWWENHYVKSLQTQIKLLEGLIESLETEMTINTGEQIQEKRVKYGRRIFLVHGRNERFLHETARYLEKLKLEIIILRDQPNEGRTIIEKFIDYSNAGFAIVLLSDDDRGGSKDTTYEEQNLRARQNVIFELGFFIGKLGRKRVCALYIPGVDIPSDYEGVLFIPFDEQGGWRLKIAREIKAAGLSVDMNLAV